MRGSMRTAFAHSWISAPMLRSISSAIAAWLISLSRTCSADPLAHGRGIGVQAVLELHALGVAHVGQEAVDVLDALVVEAELLEEVIVRAERERIGQHR